MKSLICLATDEVEAQFAAEVDANMFRHINENLLQRRYRDDASRARHSGQKPQWTYAHSHTTDKFYTVGNDRVRVSYDDATGAVLACVVKEKVAHTDWWNGKPKCIDFRISANRERKGEARNKHEARNIIRPTATAPVLMLLLCCVSSFQSISLAVSVTSFVARIVCRTTSTCSPWS